MKSPTMVLLLLGLFAFVCCSAQLACPERDPNTSLSSDDTTVLKLCTQLGLNTFVKLLNEFNLTQLLNSYPKGKKLTLTFLMSGFFQDYQPQGTSTIYACTKVLFLNKQIIVSIQLSDEKLIEISTYKYRWHQMQVNITSRYLDFIGGLSELPMWFADSFWSVVFEGGGNLCGEYLAFL